MTLVKPKAETREAWQYTGQAPCEWPTWVRACCSAARYPSVLPVDLTLTRRTGKQVMRRTDWLVRNLDGDPDWLTHDQMRKTFDEVKS